MRGGAGRITRVRRRWASRFARDGIADVVIDFPPVNALPAQGWDDLAAAVAAAGADPRPGP